MYESKLKWVFCPTFQNELIFKTLFSAPVFIPGNARPIQNPNPGPQVLGDMTAFRQQLMYPYNLSDFSEITSAKPIHDQPLPFRLPFFGFSYHYVWVKF
jgi:hypothetical protein